LRNYGNKKSKQTNKPDIIFFMLQLPDDLFKVRKFGMEIMSDE